MASEKSANDLLEEETATLRDKLELLMKELAVSRSKSGANSSELSTLQAKLKTLTRDNEHLHGSLSDRDEVLKQRDAEVDICCCLLLCYFIEILIL